MRKDAKYSSKRLKKECAHEGHPHPCNPFEDGIARVSSIGDTLAVSNMILTPPSHQLQIRVDGVDLVRLGNHQEVEAHGLLMVQDQVKVDTRLRTTLS